MSSNVSHQLILATLYLWEYCKWSLPVTHSFSAFGRDISLALELRTNNLFNARRLEYNITVYPNYAGPKDEGLKQNLVNLVKVGTFIGLVHVVALSNTIYCNIQPVVPVTCNALAKREHLHQLLKSHTNSNKIL